MAFDRNSIPPYEDIVSIEVERIAGASRVRHPRLTDEWLYFSPGPKRIVDQETNAIEYGPAIIRVNNPIWFEVFIERRSEYRIRDIEVRVVDATEAAAELAGAAGIDLTAVAGTGAEGRILKEDVQEAIDAAAPPEELAVAEVLDD